MRANLASLHHELLGVPEPEKALPSQGTDVGCRIIKYCTYYIVLLQGDRNRTARRSQDGSDVKRPADAEFKL